MKDERTDAEKEQSPYFSHWAYEGNWLQRRFEFGPRKAVFKAMTDEEANVIARIIADESAEVNLIPSGVMVGTGAKAIQWNSFWANFVEQGNSNQGLLRKSPWAFRCVEIRSKAMAAVPWGIFDGDREVPDHPLAVLLREVNPELNWHELVISTIADMDVFPGAYWRKNPANGRPKFLERINPAIIEPDADKTGIKGYKNTEAGPGWNKKEIIYFHGYDPNDDTRGIPRLEVAKRAIEIEVEADRHLSQFFKNRAMPDYVMSLETTNPQELKRVSDFWKKEFGGNNQHKTGFVGGGGKPYEMGYAPDKLALEQVRAEARREICAAFGVPPALVGAWEAANYATIREQRQSLYTEGLMPDGEKMAGTLNAELAPLFGDNVEFRWKWDELPALQETVDDKAKRYSWLVQAGILKAETAALDLGFKKTDVPEEKPNQPNGNIGRQIQPPTVGAPSVSPNGGGQFAAEANQQRKASSEADEDLGKWRRKALRFVKQGKDPSGPFISDTISPAVLGAIEGQLEGATTREEVIRIFDEALEMPESAKKGDRKDRDGMNQTIIITSPDEAKAMVQMLTPQVHVAGATVNIPEQKSEITGMRRL